MALLLEPGDDRLPEGCFLFGRPVFHAPAQTVTVYRGKDAGGLFAPITEIRAFGHIHRNRGPNARPHMP